MAKKFEKEYLVEAHRFCMNNEPGLRGDSKCGCFSCISIFHPQEIKEWIDDEEKTAICPYCRTDAVIGESSGYPITTEFLREMNKQWFDGNEALFEIWSMRSW